ncbi:MAG: ABC transporter permease subunit, partial [Clostridia bacterium]|nr:ABC transporter permease subunit [Clostridia bacterium]
FGMDRLNFGEIEGYYATECGNVLGLGGAFFAAILASAMLSKEERQKTAEFLLTHPITRKRVVTEKLIAVIVQIAALNLVVFILAMAAVAMIGETVPIKEAGLLHIAYLLMQLEIAGICFGISAFMSRGSIGVGLGLAAVLYVLSIIANIADSVKFLNYVTPFGYCEGANIVNDLALDWPKIAIGMGVCVICIIAAYWKYTRKDIR